MPSTKHLYLIVATLFLVPVDAAEVYKWVDDEGRVHFGERPPQSADSRVEAVAVQSNPRIRPETVRNEIYCGSMRLPTGSDDPVIRLANAEGNLPYAPT